MISGAENTCDACPVITLLDDDLEKLSSMQFDRHELSSVAGVLAGKLTMAAAINDAALEVACTTLEKNLPEAPNPIPPMGHQLRIEYGQNCPAYRLWKSRNS